ncbi:MAG TPA: hypothetical protein VFA38_05570, partial [Nitrospirales bacterium]|nr:hypothetical protein [Nitrospirales bacterium]
VVGTLAGNPYAGMAWMHMQIAAGLLRLGHDVYYIEATSNWPYDPVREMKVNDSDYAVPYLASVAASFGMEGRWAYRRSFSDKEWLGLSRGRAEELLATADAVFNVAGATRLRTREELTVGRLVYFGTDPVYDEILFAKGDRIVRRTVDQHDEFVTYGENIGRPDCRIPPFPKLKARTRQPVLMEHWDGGPPTKAEFTTVGNWKQGNHDLEFEGETYLWSKHHEFLKVIDLPRRTSQPIEFATGLTEASKVKPGFGEAIPAGGLTYDERSLLESHDWRLVNSHDFTTDPWRYRDYVRASRGEFTVARDQNVRLQSGWFSERSACYLAAGRPVITQDTGFGTTLPTGEGLFAFRTVDEAAAAVEAVNADYARHSRAARDIARDYFRAETVLATLLHDLGV